MEKNVAKLSKDKQKVLKVLSKIISIFATIGKVLTIIGISGIVLAMIVIPIVFSKIKVEDNSIVVDKDLSISVVEEENILRVKYKDSIILDESDPGAINNLKELINKTPKPNLVGYFEVICLMGLIELVLLFLVLANLKKLFKNINEKDTPFILENVDYTRKTAYIFIGMIITSFIGEIISELAFKGNLDINIQTVSIFEILFLFVISYIFEYGYELQQKSKAKIYDNIDE